MINLDCMTSDDLEVVAHNLTKLAEYARYKAKAQNYRAAGEINYATFLETICDDIYAEISPAYKW